jgi:glutamate synthase (NADPH/NADH) small chain
MAENPMLKFVKIPRLMPQKREASDRAHDFGEIYAEFSRIRPQSKPAAVANAACLIAKPTARCTIISPIGCA